MCKGRKRGRSLQSRAERPAFLWLQRQAAEQPRRVQHPAHEVLSYKNAARQRYPKPVMDRTSSGGIAGLIFPTCVMAALIGFGIFFDRTAGDGRPAVSKDAAVALHTELAREGSSLQVRRLVSWAIATGDHAGMPFIVIDRAHGRLFAFTPTGRLLGSTPVLTDGSPGAGTTVRTRTASRLVADTWHSRGRDRIVWVNSVSALSVDAMAPAAAPRQGTMGMGWATREVASKRSRDETLHVAEAFYRQYLRPLGKRPSIAYVLPAAMPAQPSHNGYVLAHPLANGIMQVSRRAS
jgi:hypothetical protein